MRKKQILFMYTGYEQGAWGAIAFPCPAHYYIMPGILCCVSSLKNDPAISATCDIHYRFFNRTVQSREAITALISAQHWDIVGFSTFCWNRDDHLFCARSLKLVSPGTKILFGGPEVFMHQEEEARLFFSTNPFIDCVVFGDAENRLPSLIQWMIGDEKQPGPAISGYALTRAGEVVSNFGHDPETALDAIPSIYPFEADIPRTPQTGLAMVYETGRGCPHRCIFCKFGHRGKYSRRCEISRVEQELRWLLSQKIECIHFADAVFDLNPEYAKMVCDIIIKNNSRTSIFFYCSFAKLDDELASLMAKAEAQICVGIQSTNPKALKTMQRTLNPDLFAGIREILGRHRLNFYTDLIFGLPDDNLQSFAESFNRAASLNPAFIMAFPLSMIPGTELADRADHYRMKRCDRAHLDQLGLMCDIEYQHIALSDGFSVRDLGLFDDVALTLFYFYNRFFFSITYLMRREPDQAFSICQIIGEKTKNFLKKAGQKASNTSAIEGFQDMIFALFSEVCRMKSIAENEYASFKELFTLDIFRIIMLTAPQRTKFFNASYERHTSGLISGGGEPPTKKRVQKIVYGKMLSLPYRFSDLMNLSALKSSIRPVQDQVYMFAPFNRWNTSIIEVSAMDRFLLELIPANRGMQLHSVIQAVKHQFRSAEAAADQVIAQRIAFLHENGIVLIYDE